MQLTDSLYTDMRMIHYLMCGVSYVIIVVFMFFIECLNTFNIRDKRSIDYFQSVDAVQFYGKTLVISILVMSMVILVMLFLWPDVT